MPINSAPLNILLLPGRWQPPTLTLTLLVLPQGDPRAALPGTGTAFADADLTFDAMFVPTLTDLPTPASARRTALTTTRPARRRAFFDELAALFRIRPSGLPPEGPPSAVRKFLPPSFRAANGYTTPRSRFLVTDRSYDCVLKETKPHVPPPDRPDTRLEWEEVLTFVLRQPRLARELGLLYDTTLTPGTTDPVDQGGYLFADPAAGSAYRAEANTNPALLARYAARIPPLTTARPVFAAVLFPVTGTGDFDQVFVEADAYDHGFARVVHGAQSRSAAQVEHDVEPPEGALPPVKDTGIRLGWDDDQVTVWLNRQFGVNAHDTQPSPDSPLGVAGYRVDVREDGAPDAPWHSLTHVAGDLTLGPLGFGHFDGELAVETTPVNHTLQAKDEFWLPAYFTAWRGGSLVLADPSAIKVSGRKGANADTVYRAVDADAVPLRYGHTYQFRVRLTDLAGGGPLVTDQHDPSAPAPVAVVPFRRFVPPRAVRVDHSGLGADGRSAGYTVHRPLLGYPDLVYTGFPDAMDALLADLPAAQSEYREAVRPDPDVTQLRIDVSVRTLQGDPAADTDSGTDSDTAQPFRPLYTAVKAFPPAPDQPLTLRAVFEDLPTTDRLTDLTLTGPTPLPDPDPLRLPTARDVRLVLTALGREDQELGYWGSDRARTGAAPVSVYLRAPSADERQLLQSPPEGPQVQAVFLQPDPEDNPASAAQRAVSGQRVDAPSDLVDRLARQLGLTRSALTLSARAGRRLVLGAAAGLRHTLSPERDAITFATRTELTHRWLVCLHLSLERDWSWDALQPAAFEVLRDGTPVGTLTLPRTLARGATGRPDGTGPADGDGDPQARDRTELLFLDAYDDQPPVDKPPSETRLTYSLVPAFRPPPAQQDPVRQDPVQQWPLRLPITTPPGQVPRLRSAGIAATPYQRDQDRYTATGERRRLLYLELAEPPKDPADRYFARVLAGAPDPMLLRGAPERPDPAEPPLDVAEPIRVVTPSSSADCAGHALMQELIPAADGLHYLLPLPEGLGPDAPELFGFYVYELRVGHDCSRWSTAAGRFGLPLRVAGVQHPAPQLRCTVTRTDEEVTVTALHAASVADGTGVRPYPPATTISALLYAQVQQADGRDWRNVLLDSRPHAGGPPAWKHEPFDPQVPSSVLSFPNGEILAKLAFLGLPLDASLSVVAVEALPEPGGRNELPPLSQGLGSVRVLRTSPLTPVPAICPPPVAPVPGIEEGR
ncbi:hypothetical protein [Kitasatospora sp. NPDC051705]|uniref:hypothetical protein n=1 Tax=Kitasatospora sp. NPDC051705 TaxID=3364057 RepID=UPI0037938570